MPASFPVARKRMPEARLNRSLRVRGFFPLRRIEIEAPTSGRRNNLTRILFADQNNKTTKQKKWLKKH
jgi:hypothetical protein